MDQRPPFALNEAQRVWADALGSKHLNFRSAHR